MVSIIIPVFNRAHLILETIDSIIAQTYTNWECLIIDDGSTDAIIEVLTPIIKKDDRFKFYSRPVHIKKGPSACRNYGFTLAQGRYIQFFDSDDLMHNNHLNKKMESFNTINCDFTFCRLKKFIGDFKDETFLNETNVELTNNSLLDLIKGNMPLPMVAPMWQKSFLKGKKLLDETLTLNEDLEFHSRMLLNSPKFVFIDEALIFIRETENSITNHHQKMPNKYVEDFIQARYKILSVSPKNKEVNYVFILSALAEFRKALANRDHSTCEKLRLFIKNINYNLSHFNKLKLMKVFFFYKIFKWLGKGDTKFKNLLKL